VIHALHDEQDIRSMGGLSTRMKLTFGAFLVGSLALAGIPLFAGWFSKEELLSSGLALGPAVPWLWVLGVSVNVLTSFYIFRVVWIVFRGQPASSRAASADEARPVMLVPVMMLAFLAAVVGFLNIDFFGFHPVTLFSAFLQPVLGTPAAHANSGIQALALAVGTLLSLGGLALAWAVYGRQWIPAELISGRLPWLYQLSLHKFYWDEIYDVTLVRPTLAFAGLVRQVLEPQLFDGLVNGVKGGVATLADDVRSMQTGFFRDYSLIFFVCAVIGLVVLGLRLA
jgi:NADH-quinone oxidoreductase subunit L